MIDGAARGTDGLAMLTLDQTMRQDLRRVTVYALENLPAPPVVAELAEYVFVAMITDRRLRLRVQSHCLGAQAESDRNHEGV